MPRKIGDETHPWSSELGGIPQKFGPPAEDSADEGADVIVSQPIPQAPVDGKVPALELTAISDSNSKNAENSQ